MTCHSCHAIVTLAFSIFELLPLSPNSFPAALIFFLLTAHYNFLTLWPKSYTMFFKTKKLKNLQSVRGGK